IAEHLRPYARMETGGVRKPVLAAWMGGSSVANGERILNQAGIPTFGFPDTAARVFNYMWQYSYNLRGIYETPLLPGDVDSRGRPAAAARLDAARAAGRTLRSEYESEQLLATCGLPTTELRLAARAGEPVGHAESMGYPVVLKLHSYTITHKVDVGGVKLNLA